MLAKQPTVIEYSSLFLPGNNNCSQADFIKTLDLQCTALPPLFAAGASELVSCRTVRSIWPRWGLGFTRGMNKSVYCHCTQSNFGNMHIFLRHDKGCHEARKDETHMDEL